MGSNLSREPRSKEPAPAKPFKARPLNIWVTDPEFLPFLEMLAKKWHLEGKIPEPTKAQAMRYMVHNFGELERRAPRENGTLPLDPRRRTKLSLLADAFLMVGKIEGSNDLDVVNVVVDYLRDIFSEGMFLDRFIKSKGRI